MITSKKINIWTILRTFVLSIIIFITLYPIVHMVAVSFSENIYIMQNKVSFYPKGFTTRVFIKVLEDKRLMTAYKNTILYAISGTGIALFFTTCGAYALSKKNRLPFAKQINILILITMFFSGGMIPAFLAINWLKLYDSVWAVILPSCISAWNLILMRTFFTAFPQEIEESGRIDGLNDFGVLLKLVIPASSAILATIGLFYAVGYWNSFFGPFLYLKSESKFPLQVILRQIVLRGVNIDNEVITQAGSEIIPEEAIKYATILVSVIPIIAVYPFLQKYFVKGVMVGSIKG